VPYPIIPGHVTTGTLDKVRGTLTDTSGAVLGEGDRVAFFDVHRTCGRCRACTVHRTPTRCAARRVYGITDSDTEGLFGGWAQKVYLEPGVIVQKLPDAVTFEAYIGGGCGLLTSVHILDRARLSLGDTVVVQGAGAVGLSTAALARKAGAGLVVVIGAPADRLALAADMGADAVIDLDRTTPDERLARVRDLTGGEGADVVVEAAGSPRAFEEGVRMARNGGAYVIAGHYTNTGDSTINAHEHINRKHLDIRGCWGSEARHFLSALRLLERYGGEVPWARIGARTFGLDGLNDALELAGALTVPKALVDPWLTEHGRQA
jgi:L-iditol 2-dehydrogenase